jgi:hypothetical protein
MAAKKAKKRPAMMPPTMIPGENGWTAIVVAPGGVPIGYWAQT